MHNQQITICSEKPTAPFVCPHKKDVILPNVNTGRICLYTEECNNQVDGHRIVNSYDMEKNIKKTSNWITDKVMKLFDFPRRGDHVVECDKMVAEHIERMLK